MYREGDEMARTRSRRVRNHGRAPFQSQRILRHHLRPHLSLVLALLPLLLSRYRPSAAPALAFDVHVR